MPGGRADHPQYSMRAVFEAVVNAVAHRDYSISSSKIRIHMFAGRIEIFSPGALPDSLSVETLPFRQFSRNGLISSLLARRAVPLEIPDNKRTFIMDSRGGRDTCYCKGQYCSIRDCSGVSDT